MKKCMHEGCGRAAKVVPLLRVPAEGWPMAFHTPCQVIIGIESCREHFAEIKAAELLTDDLRTAFTHLLRGMGKTKPDFARATIEPLSLSSREYQEFVVRKKPDA